MMFRVLYRLWLVVILSSAVYLLPYPQALALTNALSLNPALVCDNEEYYFGSVSNTETVSHDFIISNDGHAPLYISRTRSDCGCLIARMKNDTLAPGESVPLQAKFNLKGRSGSQLRKITVQSNDPKRPIVTLMLFGEVLAPLRLIPEQIFWGNIHSAAAMEKACEILFGEGEQSYITSVSVPANLFKAEVTTITPRRHYKVTVRTVSPLPIGLVQTNLLVVTDHKRFQTIEIPMYARVISDIFAIPEEIVIDHTGGKTSGGAALLVYSGIKKKFNILKVELPQTQMQSALRPMSIGYGYRINLSNIDPAEKLVSSNIVITTDCESMPTLSVPFKFRDNTIP
jgi:hypothetical protein